MKTRTLTAIVLSILLDLTFVGRVPAQEGPRNTPRRIAVNVLGEVNKPGRYLLPEGATALDALAAAGGEKSEARLAKVKLIHANTGDQSRTDVIDMKAVLAGTTAAPVIHEGDSLHFPRAFINVSY